MRASGVHDRSNVVHPLLDGRHAPISVGQSLSALVESDQAGERGEPAKERRLKGLIPLVLYVGDDPRYEDQIGRALSNDLVRDVEVATASIARLGLSYR